MDRQSKRSMTAPKLVLEPVRESSRLESYPLAPGRYLLGSAPDCDIVIAMSGVAPQHCLMIVGANKTIVKAISPLTWINDGPLTEAVLKLGERLILGPVELRTRRPEVSEWVELREVEPVAPPEPVTYQPPQIEELLDQARQQLQTAIDELDPQVAASWSEDLSLSEAVQMHAAAAAQTAPAPEVSADQALTLERITAERTALEQRERELGERSRTLADIGTELLAREEQLRSRELALTTQEHALQVRNEAEAAASRVIAEMSRSLEAEQSRLQELDDAIRIQASRLEQQALVQAERTQTLEAFATELAQQAEVQRLQSESVQTFAAVSPVDTSHVEFREAAVAQREAVLASSMSALQASREQISSEAADLERRFEQLIERERAIQLRQSALTEQASQAEARTREATTQRAGLAEREQSVATSLANLTERDATVQRLKTELDGRDRELRGLRSELDIREEALNQQFSQLQLDRSALRAGQSKLQLAEQAANQRLFELDASSQQRSSELGADLDRRRQEVESLTAEWEAKTARLREEAARVETQQQELAASGQSLAEREQALFAATRELTERKQSLAETQSQLVQASEQLSSSTPADAGYAAELAHQQTRLDLDRAEYWQERQALEQLRLQIEEQRELLGRENSERVGLSDSSIVDRTEIDNEWQLLAAERARLVAKHRDLESDRASLTLLHTGNGEPGLEANEVTEQLVALVSERQSLAQLREQLLREEQQLRSETEEVRKTRTQFEQDYAQLLEIKTQSESERDTYLLERQSVISERQSLQDRERQIQQAEAEIEQLHQQAEQRRTESETGLSQMTSQRVHLEEEWESLRQERAELKRVESDLQAQRDELTSLAQQLTDLQTVQPGKTAEPVALAYPSPPPIPAVLAVERESVSAAIHEETVEASPESEADPESPDPLAGFASFSSIGSSLDDELPPEIAEIMRRANGPSSPRDRSPQSTSFAGSEIAPPALPLAAPRKPTIDSQEEQRLRELLGPSSESYVEAATVPLDEEPETYEVVEEDPRSEASNAWGGESRVDVWPSSRNHPSESDAASHEAQTAAGTASHQRPEEEAPKAEGESSELRSRLSAMFGIDLGRLRQPHPPASLDPEPPVMEAEEAPTQPAYSPDLADAEQDDTRYETQAEDSPEEYQPEEYQPEEPVVESPSTIDASLDPVAAYMEQLLARTRTSKDGRGKSEPPAPAPPPPPVVSALLKEQLTPPKAEEPVPAPARPPRKLEAAEKQAMRANLDSFRTIANTQARSDVARSELRRLKITEKVKQIFLSISGGIALILATTELWTTRRYRFEMTAAVIATAFLGYDYFRTQRRLRELESIAPLEAEDDDDGADGAV